MSKVLEDFKVNGLWVKSLKTGHVKQEYTRSATFWYNMRDRCQLGGLHQKTRQTYIGCEMSEVFRDYQLFATWCQEQVGYRVCGNQLDKDVLVKGNKIYSETTCVFIPQALNSFLTNCTRQVGEWPLGVNLDKKRNKFIAMIREGSHKRYIGGFDSPLEAHYAYKAAKEAEAYRWYERLKDGEFVVDERVIERMRTWTLEIE